MSLSGLGVLYMVICVITIIVLVITVINYGKINLVLLLRKVYHKAFILIALILIGCSLDAKAQNMVSMASIHPVADTVGISKNELAIRYPALRRFGVSASFYGYSEFHAKVVDNTFATGQMKTQRVSSYFNTPAAHWDNNSLSATVFYTHTSTELKEITGPFGELFSDKNTLDLALNYSRSDKIFDQAIIYSLVARAISDNLNTIRRFNFNGSFSLPLRKDDNTSFSLGLLVLIDPSAPFPVEPIVNYYRKFVPSGLELIVDLPNGVNLKKSVAKNTWLSIGSNQTSYSTFYNHHSGFLDGKVSYNTIELKSGAAFEYLFAKNIIVNVGGGINSFLASRLFKDGENYKRASIRSTNKSSPYLTLGLSLLSF